MKKFVITEEEKNRIKSLYEEKPLDGLNKNGCTTKEYTLGKVFVDAHIPSGFCFIKNSKGFGSHLNTSNQSTRLYEPDYSNIIPDAVSKNELSNSKFWDDSSGYLYFFCNKSKSPLDVKSHLVNAIVSAQGNLSQTKVKKYLPVYNNELEAALSKFFCKT